MAKTQSQILARIEEIDEIIASGVSSTGTDGTTVTFDLEALRKERQELRRQSRTEKAKKPRASGIYLGGF